MYKIVIANEKGGVAKTTTCASLGATLAEIGKRVLTIDLDAQGNLSLGLGVEPSKVQSSISNSLLEGTPLSTVLVKTAIPNLDLVPANSEIGLAERYLPIQQNYEFVLRQQLQRISNQYDFVLIDCPPFLGAVTTVALVASDLLLVPTQAEYYSIYALRNLMEMVRQIRKKFNPGLTYRLLLTMVDQRNRIHRVMSEQLRESFSSGVLNTIIGTDTKLRESPVSGISILTHAPKSRAALQYRNLAQEIIDYVEIQAAQPQ